jgi:hypothetical protein
MDIEKFKDEMDTFGNSVVTHSISIKRLSDDIVKNGQLFADELNKLPLSSELVNSWTIFIGNIESFMEATANFMEDFQTYDNLVVEALQEDEK